MPILTISCIPARLHKIIIGRGRYGAVRALFWCLCAIAGIVLGGAERSAAGLINAADVDFSLFINDRFHFLNHFFDSGKRDFAFDKDLHVLYLNPSLSFSPGPHVRCFLEAEGQFTFDFKQDDADSDIDLRNAYIQAALPSLHWINFSAGQQSLSTMEGLVYDDESPTLRIKADLERGFMWPFKIDALVTKIKDSSPYAFIELKYCFSLLESLRVSYGWFRDSDDGVARVFNYLAQDNLYASRGRVQWMGFSATKFAGNALFKFNFIYEKGSARLREKGAGTASVTTRGYLADISCEYSLTPQLSLALFFYLASGDNNPQKGTFKSFISIDPYIDKTNIFFNGGIDSQFSSDNVGLGGVQTAGVMTPGITVDYRIGDNMSLKYVFAYLFTHRRAAGEGTTYGWESDITGYYTITRNIQIFAEVNALKPGNYFKKLTGYRDHMSSEILIGINYLFNN